MQILVPIAQLQKKWSSYDSSYDYGLLIVHKPIWGYSNKIVQQ